MEKPVFVKDVKHLGGEFVIKDRKRFFYETDILVNLLDTETLVDAPLFRIRLRPAKNEFTLLRSFDAKDTKVFVMGRGDRDRARSTFVADLLHKALDAQNKIISKPDFKADLVRANAQLEGPVKDAMTIPELKGVKLFNNYQNRSYAISQDKALFCDNEGRFDKEFQVSHDISLLWPSSSDNPSDFRVIKDGHIIFDHEHGVRPGLSEKTVKTLALRLWVSAFFRAPEFNISDGVRREIEKNNSLDLLHSSDENLEKAILRAEKDDFSL